MYLFQNVTYISRQRPSRPFSDLEPCVIHAKRPSTLMFNVSLGVLRPSRGRFTPVYRG